MADITLYDGSTARTLSGFGAVQSPRTSKQQLPATVTVGKGGKRTRKAGGFVDKVTGTDIRSSFIEVASSEFVAHGASLEVSHFVPTAAAATATSTIVVTLPVYTAATSTTKEILENVKVTLSVARPRRGRAVAYADFKKALTMAIDFYTSGNPTLDVAAGGRVEDSYFSREPD